jgi:hypothetical protein
LQISTKKSSGIFNIFFKFYFIYKQKNKKIWLKKPLPQALEFILQDLIKKDLEYTLKRKTVEVSFLKTIENPTKDRVDKY